MITLEPPRGVPENTDPWRSLQLSRGGLTRFVRTALQIVGIKGEVDVLLTGDRALQRLNRTFRGKNKPTDVLSFPAPAEVAALHAGDLAISLDTAARQATAEGHALRDELRILLLHGLLHLDGMDHENDGGEMAAREAALRVRLRLRKGLIARAAPPSPLPPDRSYLRVPRSRAASTRPLSSSAQRKRRAGRAA